MYFPYSQRERDKNALTVEKCEERALANKHWQQYTRQQSVREFQLIEAAIASQTRALDELRQESEVLYQKAIEVNINQLRNIYPKINVHVIM